ncbi:hypothetical protein Poli38472_010979 [Pythium oligandrum]|uniref:HSF-type DNA-binding domain-containing protein n=1 Tax=Pythium oligandrum TaxID=41045 RepID=A0A8K1CFJ5_PYTOL|nr:hypothetical protein Poli38472_010979 [Pythium oligandrum]|eukprot:TMW61916.1 hypothetical protein Poli38472_010979 [Pythium oligandrum]
MTARTTSMEASSREMAPFLRSLRSMLDTESTTIICWTVDGRAFEIHDVVALTKRILPKYFKHSKYASFQRQLNYFNFRKWTKSRTAVCTFSNPFFQRDSPQLGWRITRKRSLNSETKSNGSPRSVTYQPFSPQSLQMTTMHIAPPAGPINEVKKQPENTVLNWSSLDWVDALFPSLEMLTRLDETPVELPPPAAYWSDRYPTSRTVPC